MNPQTELDGLLAQLGQAHYDGAFSSKATAYPWLANRRSIASRGVDRSAIRWSWVRVAVPLAAAAAVAVLFVMPNLVGTRAGHESVLDGLAVVSPETQSFADAEPAATQCRSPDCDYNGDGVIDGRDIQALVDQLRGSEDDVVVKADYLQRCLLGS